MAKLFEWHWRQRYRRRFGRWPSLSRPRSFNEHVAAGMFGGRDRRWVDLADKVRVKEWVADKVGADWVTPTLFAGTALPPPSERDWPLPFTIKANNASRRNCHVRTSADADWPGIEKKCRAWMRRRHAARLGEWHYDQMPPRILVEPFLEEGDGTPVTNYQLWCFGGRAVFTQISLQIEGVWHNAFYDRQWRRQPFSYIRQPIPHAVRPPASLGDMTAGAEVLARDFDFVRVDLYEYHGRPRFGEMTFTPSCALGRFFPARFNEGLGEIWREAMARRRREMPTDPLAGA